jgi:8-oxo-dGTP pyrophosphatase MutT (NUDIX family)|tara:strand:- start:484 stop:978 length:495 start_codon:yes stop_codon:yes gene_type:complete
MSNIKSFEDFINEDKKFLETRYSAGLVIIFDGKILLGQSSGRKPNSGYGISKGGIEEGESRLEAAIRETKEEFGIKIPRNLINKQEYTFTLTSRKYKYNKVVYYYIVEISSLSQIGLKSEDVPKRQLQLEEIGNAKFFSRDEAMNVTMQSQLQVLQALTNKGLI